jgi:heme exporter protein A
VNPHFPDLHIELHAVAHQFGWRQVFAPVSASVSGGQTLVISGINGAGKSTLLRIIAGLLTPSEGKVTVRVGGKEQEAEKRRTAIGYVAPDLTLYKELSAAENLLFFARLRGITLTKEDLIERLTHVGLRGRGRDLVGTYSSGMRQRLKYAFALLSRPPILLLDEPTANLDVHGIAIVEEIISRQREQSGIVIVGTNEPRELEWGDSVIRLEVPA